MKIAELMTEDPSFCTAEDAVIDCARMMARDDIGMVPICESRDTRKAIGVVTDRDIVVRVVADGRDASTVLAREAMSPDLVACSPTDDAERCRELMQEYQLHRVLVVDEHGSLVGLVATADLARAFEKEKVGETLQSIHQPTE
jgi:CBS domain-containing protein